MRKFLRQLGALQLVCLIAVSSSTLLVLGLQNTKVDTSVVATRSVPLSIRIVFIGFNQSGIDTTYMNWRENIPFKRVSQILSEPRDAGVVFNLDYDFIFASSQFEKELVTYLKKMQVSRNQLNPWFGVSVGNSFYDANKVEEWLFQNREMYGGLPPNGYTFLVANLTQLPSITYDQLARPWMKQPPTPHYYSVEYQDLDLGYRARNRDFMTAWGGHHRFWFIDLSAGPSFNTPNDAPLQAVITSLGIDLRTVYGIRWLTEYLSDYIWESVLNLAVPQFTYAPKYSERYHIVVTILDNRTNEEKRQIPINRTVGPDLIQRSYKDLAPYSDVKVTVKFKNCSDDPELLGEIRNSYKRSADPTQSYVDLRPLYRFFQVRLNQYVANISQDEKEFTIPVFCFAFSQSYLGYTYKWDVSSPSRIDETFSGLAQEDMVLGALTQVNEFDRGNIVDPPQPTKGMGFTQLIVHEVGHILGLMHPHQYGDINDFVSSPMSYFCYEYNFSQFDKDALRRMHTDEVAIQTTVKLTELKSIIATKATSVFAIPEFSRVERLLVQMENQYSSMNYTAALASALEARKILDDASPRISHLPSAVAVLAQWILILGVAVGYFVWRWFEAPYKAKSVAR
jgi:hypothetical protein